MAPRDNQEVVAVGSEMLTDSFDLEKYIIAEMREQMAWEGDIPAWHPRNEVQNPPADPPKDPPKDPPADPPKDPPGSTTPPSQEDLDKAYEKLRDAERERDRLNALVKKGERAGMEENERLKAEADDARNEAAALQEKLDGIEWEGDVTNIAKQLKFKKPEMGKRFVDKTTTDPKKIKRELEDAIKDLPELAGTGEPPPPVNDPNKPGGSENDRMNAALRAAAGRGR